MQIGKNCQIHQTAIIEKGAIIGNNTIIGAYSIVGKNVEIGEDNIIKSHVVIEGRTKIGNNNVIFSFAAVGQVPQDLKFAGEDSKLIIGNNNKIREHVTIHLGTKDGAMVTTIGDNCLLMVGVHIAHDCIVGNNVILANNATLAGHVELGDNVIIGGLSALHQFVKVGKFAMIGGMSGVENNVIPYGMVIGERAHLAGLNLVGLKRGNFSRESIHALRNLFKKLFVENDNFSLLEKVDEHYSQNNDKIIQDVINFIKEPASRGLLKAKTTSEA